MTQWLSRLKFGEFLLGFGAKKGTHLEKTEKTQDFKDGTSSNEES